MESVKLESKLTSGFPAMTATVQVHKRGPRHRQLKWIVENLIRAALIYGVNQALDYLKSLLQELLQRSLGNGGPGKRKPLGLLCTKNDFYSRFIVQVCSELPGAPMFRRPCPACCLS